jgi:hypothetical protein
VEFVVCLEHPKLYCATIIAGQVNRIPRSCQESTVPAVHNFVTYRTEADSILQHFHILDIGLEQRIKYIDFLLTKIAWYSILIVSES